MQSQLQAAEGTSATTEQFCLNHTTRSTGGTELLDPLLSCKITKDREISGTFKCLFPLQNEWGEM